MKLRSIITWLLVIFTNIGCLKEGALDFPFGGMLDQIPTNSVPGFEPGDATTVTLTKEESYIELNWVPVDGAVGYRVYRSTVNITEPSDDKAIGITAGTLFRDFSVVNYTTYYYVVVPLYAIGNGPMSSVVSMEFNDDWNIKWIIPQSKIPFSSKPTRAIAAFRNDTDTYAQSILIYDYTALTLYSMKCVVYSGCVAPTLLYTSFAYSESNSRMQTSGDHTIFTYPNGTTAINTSTYLSRIQPSSSTLPATPTEKQTITEAGNINMVAMQSKGVDFDTVIYMVVSVQSPATIKLYYAYSAANTFVEVGSLTTDVGVFPAAIAHRNGTSVYVIHTDDSGNMMVSKFNTTSTIWVARNAFPGHPYFSVNQDFTNTILIGQNIYFVGYGVGGFTLYEYNTTTDTITGTRALGSGLSFVKMVDKYLTYVNSAGVHVIQYPFISSEEIDPTIHKLDPPAGKDVVILDVIKFYNNSYNFFYWTNEDGSASIKIRTTR